MRILAISDIHDNFEAFPPEEMPEAELCLVAGDLTNHGTKGRWRLSERDRNLLLRDGVPLSVLRALQGNELSRAERWLTEMGARLPVLWIPGNHDIGVDADTFADVPGCTCLLNRTVEALGLTIHGVSLAPCYDKPVLAQHWDYMTADPEEERVAFDFEPADIVVSHSPPLGHCDRVGSALDGDDLHIGSARLLDYIERYAPRLVLCGHVHEGQGASLIGAGARLTRIYNVACTYAIVDVP